MHWLEKNYVLVLDYYSHFPDIALLYDPTAKQVIICVKTISARHGIPDIVMSDSGPQFSGHEFKVKYGFRYVTSSLRSTDWWEMVSK